MKHDLFDNSEKSTEVRHQADKILADEAMQRFGQKTIIKRSKDASLSDKLAALGVVGVMKAKVKLGMGLRSRKSQPRQMIRKCLTILQKTKTLMENTLRNLQNDIEILHGDFNIIKKSVPQRKYSAKNKANMQPKSDLQEKDTQTILDQPINLPMEIEVNRKRKLDIHENNDADNNFLPSKRAKIVNAKPRKIRMSRRNTFRKTFRITDFESLFEKSLASLSTESPQATEVETRKRKLDMVSDNESDN